MNSLGIILFWCVAQVTVLTLVAGILYFVGRRLGPATGAFVSLGSLLLVTLITALSFSPWPNWLPAIETRLSRSSSVDNRIMETVESVPAENSDELPPAGASAPTLVSPLAAAAEGFWKEVRSPQGELAPSSPLLNWAGLIAVIVLTGATIGSIRLVMGLQSVRRYRLDSEPIRDASVLELMDILAAQIGCTRPIEVRESRRVPGAATIGWRHPLILLPPTWREWSEFDRRAVLAHELAHIHHGDYLTWLLAQIGLVLHFYHPLAHWLCRCLRMDQELIADSTAARLVGGYLPYLQSLAKIALQQSEAQLSWPARTFLPTRRTFLRRIEMLRDSKDRWLAQSPRPARWIAALILFATGVAVLGLRGPGGADSGVANAQQLPPAKRAASDRKTNNEPIGLAYVPRDAVAVIAGRPATLLQRPALEPVVKLLEKIENLDKQIGIDPAQIESLQVVMLPPSAPPPFAAIIRLSNADAAKKLVNHLAPNATKEVYGTQEYFRQEPGNFYFLPDEKTVVLSGNDGILHRCIVAGPSGASTAKWSSAWNGVAKSDIAAVINGVALRGVVAQSMREVPPAAAMSFGTYSPLWEMTEVAALGIQVSDSLKLHAVATSANAEDAKRVHDTLMAAATMAKNALSQGRQAASTSRTPDAPLLLGSIDLADELLDGLKVAHSNAQVTVDLQANTTSTLRLVSALAPGVTNAREAARRQVSQNNMKQIALAFHNFADANQHFPPAVMLGPNNVPRSWRIELLPYLEAAPLYEQYRKDEPWDSEHNKLLLAQMPAVFRNPADDSKSTNASYFVLTGPGTVFADGDGTRFAEILDGTSNTILLVDAKRDIPWTKPEDIPYAPDKPLPKFGGWMRGGYNVGLADGSVRYFADTIDQNLLRLLITKADGQPVPQF